MTAFELKIFCDIVLTILSISTLSTIKAFYLVSKHKLLSQVNIWNKHLPFITPYYAVKSNPDPRVIKWLCETKTVNVDCASPNEMNLTLENGYTSEQILYANTMKSHTDIKGSLKYNVKLTTVDSVEAVEQIANVKWNPDILVRLAVDDSGARSPFSIKFGARKEEWRKILDTIDHYKLPFKGVSFHVGSASSNPEAFVKAIQTCQLFQKYCKRYIDTVDIGGGFLPEVDKFMSVSNKISKEVMKWNEYAPKKWIAEPGRFFSNPIQTLYVPIVFCKESEYNRRYILDDSLYGQFTSIPFDYSRPYWVHLDKYLNPIQRPKTNKDALFFGKTCDSMDFIALHKNAPKYKVGDILAFPNMGAYTNATASCFNGFDLPLKKYINEDLPNYITQQNDSILHPISIQSEIPLSISKELH